MPNWFKKLFKRTPKFTITIFMKSGNHFQLHDVEKFTVNTSGDSISSIEWKLPKGVQLMDITLSQIECVMSQVQ